jgi:hypothetical protein
MFQSPFTVENGGTIPQHKERWRSDVTDGDDPEWEQWDRCGSCGQRYFSLVPLRVLSVLKEQALR